MYKCDFCGYTSQLDFSPRHHPDKWRNFSCLKCGKSQTNAITAALVPQTSFTTSQIIHVTISAGFSTGPGAPLRP